MRRLGQCHQCAFWGTQFSIVLPKDLSPINRWYPCCACHHGGRKALVHPSKNFYLKRKPMKVKP